MPRPQTNIPRPCVCTTVRTASRLIARTYDAALQGTGLNVTQLAVLRAIERMGDAPLSQIAALLSMDRTSLYRSVAKMSERGWLQLSAGRDARSRRAVIQDPGREVLDHAAPHWESAQSEIVRRFGRRRWNALVEELSALSNIVSEVSSDTPPKNAQED